jgi:hypothetical protein
LRLVFGGSRIQFPVMIARVLPPFLFLVFCAGPAWASDDVAEQSHVMVPDGIFGSMRKVDSETYILPDASAVLRRQQQRTAAQESRERAAQRAEAERLSNAARTQTTTPAAVVEPSPEAALVEESVQAATAVEEPSAAVAEPAPASPDPEPEPTAEPEPTPAEEATEP